MTPIKITPNEYEYSEGFSSIHADKSMSANGEVQFTGYVKDCHLKVGDFVITVQDKEHYWVDLHRVSGYESGMVMMLINLFMDEMNKL